MENKLKSNQINNEIINLILLIGYKHIEIDLVIFIQNTHWGKE